MSWPAQFAFDLVRLPAYGEEDFFVSPSNREAIGWLERWPDWPAYGLEVIGPSGSGKTHLLKVWQARSGARLVDAAETLPPLDGLAGPGRAVAVDNAHRVAGSGEAERWLFHLLNMTREGQGSALISAAMPETRWGLALPDLASRLAALPAARIEGPDDTLLAATLVKQLTDLGAEAAPAAISYLVPRMDRSFEAARRLARQLNQASLAARRPITVPLARQVLARLSEPPEG